MIEGERDAWILVAAQHPEQMSLYMALMQQQLDDPATVDVLRDLASMIYWAADDPRVAAVSDRLVDLLEAAEAGGSPNHDEDMTDELAQLLDGVFLDSVPTAQRLLASLEKRGWRGWTKIERIAADPLAASAAPEC